MEPLREVWCHFSVISQFRIILLRLTAPISSLVLRIFRIRSKVQSLSFSPLFFTSSPFRVFVCHPSGSRTRKKKRKWRIVYSASSSIRFRLTRLPPYSFLSLLAIRMPAKSTQPPECDTRRRFRQSLLESALPHLFG